MQIVTKKKLAATVKKLFKTPNKTHTHTKKYKEENIGKAPCRMIQALAYLSLSRNKESNNK